MHEAAMESLATRLTEFDAALAEEERLRQTVTFDDDANPHDKDLWAKYEAGRWTSYHCRQAVEQDALNTARLAVQLHRYLHQSGPHPPVPDPST